VAEALPEPRIDDADIIETNYPSEPAVTEALPEPRIDEADIIETYYPSESAVAEAPPEPRIDEADIIEPLYHDETDYAGAVADAYPDSLDETIEIFPYPGPLNEIADIPVLPDPPRDSGGAPVFAVPVIKNLEQGKFYIQLGAFGVEELVENEIARIDPAYPLVVQSAGDSGKPIYRILLGPLNQGESGAVLRRFRGIGYTDAFIRRN
jgi:hypothetical protein